MTMNVDTNYAPLNICKELTTKNVSFHICVTIQNTQSILKTCPTKTSEQKTVFCEMRLSHQWLWTLLTSRMCTVSPTLMNMAAVYSEMSEHFLQITWCHIPHQTLFWWLQFYKHCMFEIWNQSSLLTTTIY